MNVTALIPPNFEGETAVFCAHRKFHRELVDDLLGISINDEAFTASSELMPQLLQ